MRGHYAGEGIEKKCQATARCSQDKYSAGIGAEKTRPPGKYGEMGVRRVRTKLLSLLVKERGKEEWKPRGEALIAKKKQVPRKIRILFRGLEGKGGGEGG